MLEHGGNLALAAEQYGIPLDAWLDLSTGINPHHYPLSMPPSILWQRLPDDKDGLTEAACAYYGAPFALPTAGSQAALQLLPKLRPTCRIAMPKTMYQEHAHAWQTHGHTVTFFEASPHQINLNEIDVLLVCNPNNPTGQVYPKHQLLAWHAQLSRKNGWLIVDEAFMDACPDESIAADTHLAGLFVLKSLGKFFGLAGIRVGCLLAQQQQLNQLQEHIGPWSITGPSRYIAKQALQDTTWQTNTRHQLITERQQLQQILSAHGLAPAGSTALFQYVLHPNANQIQAQLAQRGVWVRYFAQPSAIRVGLPPAHGWQQLTAACAALNLD